MSRGPLSGAGILVTRPAHQADGLCRGIARAGGEALHFPTIAIAPLHPAPRPPRPAGEYDWLVFISPNAVSHGWPLVTANAQRTLLAAVGPATAKALAVLGRAADLAPAGADSESLLAEPALMDLSGRRVLIVRGVGGRELLAQTLRRRGAEVDYLEVYRRDRPRADTAALLGWWAAGRIQAVTITSETALQNLHDMLNPAGRDYLRHSQLVVAGPRMLKLAQQLGKRAPIVAAGADDDAMLETLIAWWNSEQNPS